MRIVWGFLMWMSNVFFRKRIRTRCRTWAGNTITALHSGLFDERQEQQFVYFVHSYYVPVNPFTAATTDYILPFSAALHKDNFYATQFHPEKSGSVGEAILHNFLKL